MMIKRSVIEVAVTRWRLCGGRGITRWTGTRHPFNKRALAGCDGTAPPPFPPPLGFGPADGLRTAGSVTARPGPPVRTNPCQYCVKVIKIQA